MRHKTFSQAYRILGGGPVTLLRTRILPPN